MIDVHTHILPGMDDGSKDVEMSIAMLREEQQQGVETVVFTPHFYAHQNSPRRFLERREKAWNELQKAWTEETPKLRLGAEVQYFEGICQAEDLPELCIQGTDLLLLEMPFCKWTERMVRDVLELQDRSNMTVLLAHLDRYEKFYRWDMVETMLRAGVLVQLNCSVFEHFFSRKKALKMLRTGQVHLFGSDCHNLSGRAPTLGHWKKYVDDMPMESLLR